MAGRYGINVVSLIGIGSRNFLTCLWCKCIEFDSHLYHVSDRFWRFALPLHGIKAKLWTFFSSHWVRGSIKIGHIFLRKFCYIPCNRIMFLCAVWSLLRSCSISFRETHLLIFNLQDTTTPAISFLCILEMIRLMKMLLGYAPSLASNVLCRSCYHL